MNGPRRSRSQEIFSELWQRLDDGDWPAGHKLPSIRQLAQSHGVTALTISRVIRRLSDAGYVKTIPGKGVYAVERSPVAGAAPLPDTSWQQGTLRRHPFRSFTVHLPRGVPDDAINLASGTMSNRAVPIQSIRRALRDLAATYDELPVSERSAQGELPLREWFAEYLGRFGINAGHDDYLVVSSTHQAFRIIGAATIDPGDTVLIESPSDPIVVGVFEAAGSQCIGVHMDDEGMLVDQAEKLIARYRPKLLVTCSTGQVPTGVTMSIERRKRLVDLAVATRTLILEYDNSNEVYYDTPPPPPIKQWDRDGTVVYVRDFSRITAAGLRLSGLTMKGPLFDRLLECKRRDDLISSTVAQFALLGYVRGKDFERNLVRLRAFYSERRSTALAALQERMPPGVAWIKPDVGFHIWVTLPPHLSARVLTQEAAANGVIIAPNEIFSIDGKLDAGIRITFADNPPELIAEGIGRLADTMSSLLSSTSLGGTRRVFEVV